MRSRFVYSRPSSLDEALAFLAENGPRTALVAGGTDLSIAIRTGELKKDYVLDVSRLEETRIQEMSDRGLALGACLTHSEVVRSPLVARRAPVLAAAAVCVGSAQIRNAGTLGGNVANASPAADTVPAMMVHNASAVIQSIDSVRVAPLGEVITGPYSTSLQPNEMITSLVLEPMPEGYGFNFERIARRRALAIARINAAAIGAIEADGTILDVRLSMGSITPRPGRLSEAEEHMRGKVFSFELAREAAELVSAEMIRKSGVRASTEYKKPAVEGLAIKTICAALGQPIS